MQTNEFGQGAVRGLPLFNPLQKCKTQTLWLDFLD
jgi:hypothetical protein